jgi:carboxymethylenebutenolidase
MPEELKEICREYEQGKISRRDFITKAIAVTGSLAAANSLLANMGASEAGAATVASDDPAVRTQTVEYQGKGGQVAGYLASPAKDGKYPALIVIHENQGLNDHIRDVARRFAKESYVALAPDFLSRQGGTAKANPKGGGISNIREIAPWKTVAEDVASGFAYLDTLPNVRSGTHGLVGFCWGGEMTFAAATQLPDLDAAVVYYGRSPNPIDLVKDIKAPVMAHYGEKDPGVNKGIEETVEAMKKYNRNYDHKIYSDAQHAFNNDANKERYSAGAAQEAWGRTLEFFKKNLKA